jgi:hypothetical protein
MWATDFATVIVNIIAILLSLLSLFLPIVLYVGFRCLARRRQAGCAVFGVYILGWLLTLAFGPLLFPAHERLILPPPSVQASAQALEQRLRALPMHWDTTLTGLRQNGHLELLPAPKGIGHMPAHPWAARWRSGYDDGSRVEMTFFLNGVDPPKLISASFRYPRQADELLDAQALLHRIDANPSTAPWSWALPVPQQPPINLDATIAAKEALHIKARYSEQLSIRWTRRLLPDSITEDLSQQSPSMTLYCRKPWRWLRICWPAKQHNG